MVSPRNFQVTEVIERNDCAGRKSIYVSSRESDESINTLYRLTPAFLPPHVKLQLACVSPMDIVSVVDDAVHGDLIVSGDYITNHSDVRNRDPLCRCGTFLVSDGFDIHCPNQTCPLTITARLERLGNITFNDGFEEMFEPDSGLVYSSLMLDGNPTKDRPFSPILQGLFWGNPGQSLEHILMTKRIDTPLISTFMVEPLFCEYAESNIPHDSFGRRCFDSFAQFYLDMEEMVSRRNTFSRRQNILVKGFLQGLGLERLTDHVIGQLMAYESRVSDLNEPMVAYAHILTDIKTMMEELGFHQIEAQAVFREVYSRRHDLFDIFYHYSHNNEDIVNIFKRIP
jgi:hypothetical protein